MRISGVPVGKVVKLELGPGETTDATIQLDERYAPIPRDARAILRSKTLLGETYVELTPGDQERRHAAGGRHAARRAGREDGRARRDLPRARPADARARSRSGCSRSPWASQGRGPDLNNAFGNLAPFAEDTNDARSRCSTSRTRRVQQLVRNTGIVFDALSRRSGELTGPDPQLEHRLRHDRGRATSSWRRRSARSRRSSASRSLTLQPPQPLRRRGRTRSSRSCARSRAS